MITQDRVRELFDYDADTGLLTWKIRTANCIKIGSVAGSNHQGI